MTYLGNKNIPDGILFICVLCNKKHINLSPVVSLEQIHIPDTCHFNNDKDHHLRMLYKKKHCPFCNLPCERLIEHTAIHHSDKIGLAFCGLCDEVFLNNRDLDSHYKTSSHKANMLRFHDLEFLLDDDQSFFSGFSCKNHVWPLKL